MVVNDRRQSADHRRSASSNSAAKEVRKMRFQELRYPEDVKHPLLVQMMMASESFHMWFEESKTDSQQRKSGGLSLIFETEEIARQFYQQAKDIVFEVNRPAVVQANKSVMQSPVKPKSERPVAIPVAAQPEVEPETEPDPTDPDVLAANDPDVNNKLYISNLLPSTDHAVVLAIFGEEKLKQVTLLMDEAKADNSKIAVVCFNHPAEAVAAKEEFDGFSLDDGDMSRPMRIILFSEHIRQLHGKPKAAEKAEAKAATPEQENGVCHEEDMYLRKGEFADRTAPTSKPADKWAVLSGSANQGGTVEPETLQQGVLQAMQQSGLAWAAIATTDDLWALLEQVVAAHGSAPEQELMRAMLVVLEKAKVTADNDWTYKHLGQLLGKWKSEMRTRGKKSSEQSPSQPQMGETKKRLVGLMGVGALLSGMNNPEGEETEEKAPEPVPEPVEKPQAKPEPVSSWPPVPAKAAAVKAVAEPPKAAQPQPQQEPERRSKHTTSPHKKKHRKRERAESSSSDSSSSSSDGRSRKHKKRKHKRTKSKQKHSSASASVVPATSSTAPPANMMSQMMNMMNQAQTPAAAGAQPGAAGGSPSLPMMMNMMMQMQKMMAAQGMPAGASNPMMNQMMQMMAGQAGQPQAAQPAAAPQPSAMQQMLIRMQAQAHSGAASQPSSGQPSPAAPGGQMGMLQQQMMNTQQRPRYPHANQSQQGQGQRMYGGGYGGATGGRRA